jgi:ABC-type uncharacterized transport system auxiliary subunit
MTSRPSQTVADPGRAAAALIALALAACGGKLAETRYYQLAAPEASRRAPEPRAAMTSAGKPRGGEVLVVQPLTTDAGYDDERIVYRTPPFRVDYYQYHRWTSAPGVMVGNYLERALENSGQFRAVVREPTPDAPVVLSGRVLAIEEIDRSKVEWVGRIALELTLTDARTGALLWTDQLDETEPLRQQSPEGLAAALSIAMSRIVAQVVPTISDAIRTVPDDNPAAVSHQAPEGRTLRP